MANKDETVISPVAVDMVNHPSHYASGEIECIEVIKEITKNAPTQYAGYCLGNFIKYVWRCNNKNGWEDIRKGEWYLKEFIKECNNAESK